MADYISALTGPEMDAALQDMAEHNSEAWAVGARDGVEVGSTDITYHNNAEYYAESANAAAARAEAAVPSGTAGAVFFDRSQTLTEAQQTRARTNIGAQKDIADTLQFEDSLAIGTRKFTTANVQTGGAGWYRVADIDLTRASSVGQIFHASGLIILGGFYSAYKPSKGVFCFTYDGGTAYGNIVQLGGVVSNSPTQIRILNTSSGHSLGQGHLLIDLYFSDARLIQETASVIAGGARAITMQDPELITGTPTGETVRATLTIGTTPTGAALTGDPTVLAPASLADLRNQLITLHGRQRDYSTGFYAIRPASAFSPFFVKTYQVELFRIDGGSMVCSFKAGNTTEGIQFIGMNKTGSTWSTPREFSKA